jgi:DNA-binding CsgD family transcriptional regulator
LAGKAGIGKTRLAQECLANIGSAGFAPMRVTATRAAAGIRFGAVAPLVRAIGLEGQPPLDDRDFLDRISSAAANRSAGRGLLVLVDDAHLLDDASATLVHQLVETDVATILAVVRTGEPASDPILALWKDGHGQRIDLAALDAESLTQLLSTVLAGSLDGGTLARITSRCQGNLHFLKELVLGAVRDGSLRVEEGLWRLAGPIRPSRRLVELIEGQLRHLQPEERAVLERISMCEPFGPTELQLLESSPAVESLEEKFLIESYRDGRRLQVSLSHPLLGDVTRCELSAVKAAAVAHDLAQAVQATGARRREDALRIGSWLLEAGEAGSDLLLAGAVAARWRNDFELAERLALAARAATGGFDAAMLCAELAALQGRGSDADREFEALAAGASDDLEKFKATTFRLNNLLYMGQHHDALDILTSASSSIGDPEMRLELAAIRAEFLLIAEGPKAAIEITSSIRDQVTGRALAIVAMVEAYSFARLGRFDSVRESIARVRHDFVETAGLSWYPSTLTVCEADALTHAGRPVEAESVTIREYEQAISTQSRETQAMLAMEATKVYIDRGRVTTAIRYGREAVVRFRQLGHLHLEQCSLSHLVHALALGGHGTAAQEELATLDAMGLPQATVFATEHLQARAWASVAIGDVASAKRLLHESAALGNAIGDLVGEAAALHGIARLGNPRAATRRLEALAELVEGDLVAARAAHTRALSQKNADELGRISLAFEAMGAHLLAAEAAADAATAWRRAAEQRRATAARRRATALLDEHCEGAITPAIRRMAAPAELTPAEFDAAVLAADGQSNKEIALTLRRGIRTVEGQLLRAYQKLGVASRSELAEILGT